MTQALIRQRADLTHKHNLGAGRHGWLRLTPAYSRKVVEQILDDTPDARSVYDPFSGSGTTAMSAAFRGLSATATELNPFLVWLGTMKLARYSDIELQTAQSLLGHIIDACSNGHAPLASAPLIHRIERWWGVANLSQLRALKGCIDEIADGEPVRNLMLCAFCRTLIRVSNAAFNHQSMSFKPEQEAVAPTAVVQNYREDLEHTLQSARDNPSGEGRILLADARTAHQALRGQSFDLVITSPPYPNRMSYIRELRPYMYWLGYLTTGREAGELDWQAIGGTWGVATSRLADWSREEGTLQLPRLTPVLERVRHEDNKNGELLANYIDRYFADMHQHLIGLTTLLQPGARVHYIVGNSTFYGALLPVELLFADLFALLGFEDIAVRPLRKRNSKKELIEFDVTARWRG